MQCSSADPCGRLSPTSPADPYGRVSPPPPSVCTQVSSTLERAWGEVCFTAGAFLYFAEYLYDAVVCEFTKPLHGNAMHH